MPYSTRNPIEYQVPELLCLDSGLVDIPSVNPGLRSRRLCARSLFNIWSTDRIYQSMYDEIEGNVNTMHVIDYAHHYVQSPLPLHFCAS